MGFWSEATACALRKAISCPHTVPRPKSSRSSATTAITARNSSPVTTTFPTQRPEALPGAAAEHQQVDGSHGEIHAEHLVNGRQHRVQHELRSGGEQRRREDRRGDHRALRENAARSATRAR